MLVSSVPLSLTTVCGLPRFPFSCVNSRATRRHDSDASASSCGIPAHNHDHAQDAEPPTARQVTRSFTPTEALLRYDGRRRIADPKSLPSMVQLRSRASVAARHQVKTIMG